MDTSPVSKVGLSASTADIIDGVLSAQVPGEAQMFCIGPSVPVGNSLASFVLTNSEVLSLSVLKAKI